MNDELEIKGHARNYCLQCGIPMERKEKCIYGVIPVIYYYYQCPRCGKKTEMTEESKGIGNVFRNKSFKPDHFPGKELDEE